MFDGQLGKLPGVTTLQLKLDAVPAVTPNRKIPVAVQLELKEELNRLTRLGVIEPVKNLTPWVSQIVLARKKNGALRICLDPHELNKALMSILEDVLHDMRGAKIFTKADLSSGYWHVELDEASSDLTTFQTCFGRYRWRRLPFGLNSAAEIFQRKLVEQFQDMKGIVNIADDLMVYGTNREEHDKRLHNLFQKCQTIGVKLNPEKLEIGLDAITFMVHRITKEGIVVDPEKVRAITVPETIGDMRRFLGMINYVRKFIPNLTTVLKLLQDLTKNDVTWTWSGSQQSPFNMAKDLISKAPVFPYYDLLKELTLENDACEHGLEAPLIPEEQLLAYAWKEICPNWERDASSMVWKNFTITHMEWKWMFSQTTSHLYQSARSH